VIYVTNVISGSVSVIDSETLTVTKTIEVERRPWNLLLTADGGTAFVANAWSDSVSVIDTAQKEVVKTLEAGSGASRWRSIRRGPGFTFATSCLDCDGD